MNNTKHLRYLNLAKSISELSDFEPHKIGCILVYGKQIISVGYNCQKTHPLQKEYNRYRNLKGNNIIHKAHAETLCINRIRRLDVNLSECILYIFRQLKNGSWAMARPCESCLRLLQDNLISKIVYSTNGGYAYEKLQI